MGEVKTTVEIPDLLYRDAKVMASRQGISMKQLLTEAVRDRLRRQTAGRASEPAWKKAFGGLSDLHRENRRLARVVAEEFERIDEEDWR